ncbi:MAG: NAD-dependent epimerase/dehydratase family protein [Pseudomonadales bacterium]
METTTGVHPGGLKVLVLGGHGFIGRHAVAALRAAGAQVSVGSRDGGTIADPVVRVRLQERLAAEQWLDIAGAFDVVLNSVGILRQRPGERYEAIHHLAPAALAAACERTSTRFVHVSALGLRGDAKSRFLSSKFRGDQAVMAGTGDWMIARLSLLDGEGGFGASWLRGVAQLPLFVVPASARGKIAALTADDAGLALARLSLASAVALNLEQSRLFELGGSESYSFGDYVRGLRRRFSDRPARCIRVPGWLARLGAHCCDLVHFSPFSFGHWELLCADNVPQPNRLPELLGRLPDPVVSP